MSAFVIVLGLLLGVTTACVATARFVRTWLRTRGARVVTCPETGLPVAVKVDAYATALAAVVHERSFHLSSCSRWPERAHCNQACLNQITAAPDGCLARERVVNWYRGKTCVYCRQPIHLVNRLDRQPALLTPGGETIEWREVPIEKLPEAMRTHQPVCWSCHIAESFRRQFPEGPVDREASEYRNQTVH